jgi:hypothetical protein
MSRLKTGDTVMVYATVQNDQLNDAALIGVTVGIRGWTAFLAPDEIKGIVKRQITAGDKVRLKDRPDLVGTVVQTSGFFAWVMWWDGGGRPITYPFDDLVLADGTAARGEPR